MSLDDVVRQVKENYKKAPYLSRWKHLKSGHVYVVMMHVILEDSLKPAVIYYKISSPSYQTWCRPASEFFDGRFELTGIGSWFGDQH